MVVYNVSSIYFPILTLLFRHYSAVSTFLVYCWHYSRNPLSTQLLHRFCRFFIFCRHHHTPLHYPVLFIKNSIVTDTTVLFTVITIITAAMQYTTYYHMCYTSGCIINEQHVLSFIFLVTLYIIVLCYTYYMFDLFFW